MFNIYEQLNITSQASIIIISVAFMMIVGFALTRITKLIKLPDCTGYIIAGIIVGPFCFNLATKDIVSGMSFLADIALAFISFSVGEFFKLDKLKAYGLKAIAITVFESLATMVLTFALCYFLIHLSFEVSIILAALATATSPASILMTIRQTRSKGHYVNALLQVIAVDNIICLLIFGVASSIAQASLTGAVNAWSVIKPIVTDLGVMAVGAIFGVLMKLFMPDGKHNDNRLIIAIAMIFAFCGISSFFNVSPRLGCFSMGTIYFNMSDDDKLFKQLNYFAPPIYLLFFVRSGANLQLDQLFSNNGSVGVMPLFVVGLIYFVVRDIAKYTGAYVGCKTVKEDNKVSTSMGMALIPHASISIALATLCSRTFLEIGTVEAIEYATIIETVTIAASILNELIGPVLAKISLKRTGSYSDDIDEVVSDEEINTAGLSGVEVLIAKINKIKETIPHTDNEERAFTEAAEEYSQNYNYNQMRMNRRFKRH